MRNKDHPIYRRWCDMRNRCNNQNNRGYKYYGGRGIKVCERWEESFWNFVEDMYPSYKEGLEIDRKNNDKGYSPDNCRWSDRKTQVRNRRGITNINAFGENKNLSEYSEEYGLKAGTVSYRIRNAGLSPEEALTRELGSFRNYPEEKKIYLTRNGETKWIVDWAIETGIPYQRIFFRKKKGYPDEVCLTDTDNLRLKITTPLQQKCLDLVNSSDGAHTIIEIAHIIGENKDSVRYALKKLVRCDMITREGKLYSRLKSKLESVY